MEHYDVIIVGAGPAGLKCAETLGNSKYKVLLLEKNPEIGPKVCAGGLTSKGIKYLNLPKNLIDFHSDEVKININNSKFSLKNKNLIFTVDRKNLGQWQLKKLKKFKNITIKTNAIAKNIKKNSLTVNNKKISYKFLVGADGSLSTLKKHLGIKSNNITIAVQYIIPTEKYKDLEVFLNPRLFSVGYAWIFPHKGYTSIGAGCDPKLLSARDLTNNFNKWLKAKKIDISNSRFEAFAIDCDYQGYKFGNIFLAGDAGGFVSKFTGEGIYPALISGEEIGKMILNQNYHSDKIEDLLKIKEKHNELLELFIKAGRFRTLLLYLGALLLKFPNLKKRAIGLLI